MKCKTVTVIIVVVMAVGIVLGAETTTVGGDKNVVGKDMVAAPTLKLPSKDIAEYWVIRTQTMTEFIPFLTQKRSEFKETSELLAQFLVKIDKAQDFLNSGVKAPNDPKLYMEVIGVADRVAQVDVNLPEKPLTWEQSVELAMGIIMYDGYLPTDVADEEELQTIKRLCFQKEKYGKKVRKELRDLVQKCLNVWYYLDTIDKQAAFKEFAYLKKEMERKEKEKDREARDKRRQEQRMAQREARAAWEFERKEQGKQVRYRRSRLNYGYSRHRW